MASRLLVLLSFSSLFLPPYRSSAVDSISGSQWLSGDQKLTSNGGNFILGFFSLGKWPQRFYLGIWYNTDIVSIITPVWVANRATPILDPSSSEFKISENGTLVLLDQSKSLIWFAKVNASSNSVVVALLDTGNLVIRDRSNASRFFWQSFDHPTDTWLPGGKLGINKITGEIQHLIAWKDFEDPAPGNFYIEIDPNGSSQFFILWNGTKGYWSSGLWNSEIFANVPEMTSNFVYDFEYVNNEKENYFTYTVNSADVISRFVMDLSGQIKQLTWVPASKQWILFWSQPRAQCEVYALCGAFGSCNENTLPFCDCITGFRKRSPEDSDLGDHSGGCVRKSPLKCDGTDKFYQMDAVRLPANPRTLNAASAFECKSTCLKNCSCTAYSYNGVCSLWIGDLVNIQDWYGRANQAGTLFLRLAASELPYPQSKTTKIIVGIVSAAIFLAFASVICVIICIRERRRITNASKISTDGTTVAFRYRDLKRLTKNFSNELGRGGFGPVYRGILPDSTPFAVKKLQDLSQGEKQFRNEVSTIGTIQHINLIRLYGFCVEGSHRCLVYEFMPNSSLDTHLFHENPTNLNWENRYQIAVGIARGLAYLHEKCRDCIVHCDIKPENILLDSSFVPKVADFGLAKLIGRDISRVLTSMRGTRGYLAPEWISGVAITAKADVYSFGMMLFEIISGKRNTNHWEDEKPGFFPAFAVRNLMAGEVVRLLDSRLDGVAPVEEITRACKVACWCIQDEERYRPAMGRVVQMLEGNIEISMPAVPKSLQIYMGEQQEHILYFSPLQMNQNAIAPSCVSSGSNICSYSNSTS